MADRNPMLMNNNNPVAGLGVIPGKAVLDDDSIERRRQNAKDPRRAITCYPGGENDINHNAMPGDLAFGLRQTRDVESMDGEPNELATTSVAGLCWSDYNSQREMEDDFYFLGVVTGEEKLLNPYDRNTPDARNGFATGRVGTFSVVNNGPRTFYPGDYVKWQFPPAEFSKLIDGDEHRFDRNVVGNGQINQRARYGAPPTQFKPEIVPFDPTDLSVDLAGIFSSIISPQMAGGISDIDFKKTLCNNPTEKGGCPWTCLQDEAVAFKFGLLGVGLSFVETLIRKGMLAPVQAGRNGQYQPNTNEQAADFTSQIAENIGLWSDNEGTQAPLRDALADMFLTNIGGEEDMRRAAMDRFNANHGGDAYNTAVTVPQTVEQKYARLRLHLMSTLTNGIALTVDSNRSKIVGRSLSASAPGDTTDILFGHTV